MELKDKRSDALKQEAIKIIVYKGLINPYKPGVLLWDMGKQLAPDVTPQNAAFHPGLFCLLS